MASAMVPMSRPMPGVGFGVGDAAGVAVPMGLAVGVLVGHGSGVAVSDGAEVGSGVGDGTLPATM